MGTLRGGVSILPTPSGVCGFVFVISAAPFKAPLCKGAVSYGGIAAEIGTKNMPPACFLNVPTEGLSGLRQSLRQRFALPPQLCTPQCAHWGALTQGRLWAVGRRGRRPLRRDIATFSRTAAQRCSPPGRRTPAGQAPRCSHRAGCQCSSCNRPLRFPAGRQRPHCRRRWQR